MVNSLTRQAGLKLGPIVLDVLVKHYFDRLRKDHEGKDMPKLMQEELLYDEAFNIIKSFMEAATKHTVEELQSFSNTRTPSPPWVHVVRLLVPMSCCDEAATHLIKALGGEEVTKRVVGGTKWWQVRGVKGVDAEWIVAKKDWQEAKRRQKARQASTSSPAPDAGGPSLDAGNTSQEMPATYQPEMDEMRCILYAHGGGYYFGSIDQERYCMQRLARKINGRVFTINYRLAPQYPFPCAIQDFLAAYLYLIQPPPGALHTPVSPANIVLAGDSAGGGLCIALLQVIRDAGLPQPGGALLISPWSDLTHSFPSIHLNTATDIIPPYGLSFHKPSTLWPPPPDDLTKEVHQGLRSRIRDAIRSKPKDEAPSSVNGTATSPAPKPDQTLAPPPMPPSPTDHSASRVPTPDYTLSVPEDTGRTLHLGSAASLPLPTEGVRSQKLAMTTAQGERLEIDGQVHMYAPNYLLDHPLVSPVVSYLGGLPPLLVIASEKEVLRDEIIYLAHKAAYPDRYPVKPKAKVLYPVLNGIEERYGPTKVHLQVYDDAAHTLPVLFAFTTPGKYCFRAMATFIKYITGMLSTSNSEDSSGSDGMDTVLEQGISTVSPASTQVNLAAPATADSNRSSRSAPPSVPASTAPKPNSSVSPSPQPDQATHTQGTPNGVPPSKAPHDKSIRRAFSASVTRATSGFLRRHHTTTASGASSAAASGRSHGRESTGSSDVGGPRFREKSSGAEGVRHAGEPSVYDHGLDTMIRERVSTRGVIRPLEPESELAAFRLPPELVGEISELAARRYMDGVHKFGRKFARAAKAVEKERRRNLERAKQDTMRNMAQLQTFLHAGGSGEEHEAGEGRSARAAKAGTAQGVREGLAASGSWPWAWALDLDENPPRSSIVSRRDTEEARRLAKIADQAVLMDEQTMSGNNLWSLLVNFITVTPERDAGKHKHKHSHEHSHEHDHGHKEHHDAQGNGEKAATEKEGAQAKREGVHRSRREKFVSRFAKLVAEHRKSRGARQAAKGPGEQ
ncbi:alpha/beta-hydrolase [Trametes coccinea BRFM310]|uniref:Alpha/beta-hydrolase n=1 Tax=Trametes coccinea (strain BRFM310) TaxID=1353009 RepID=A0A1Y2IH36_TRAC3|nr:alpha/beta-hydrolase [Trametes coccinea BRFM310]